MMNPSDKSIPSPMKVIRGTIISNKEASNKNWDRQALRSAFIDNDLQELYDNGKWGVGGISFNSHTPIRGRSDVRNAGIGKHDAAKRIIRFAISLNRVMQTQVAKELELRGFFEVTIDTGRYPVVFNVDIEDGEVSYQQAELVWSEKTIFLN